MTEEDYEAAIDRAQKLQSRLSSISWELMDFEKPGESSAEDWSRP